MKIGFEETFGIHTAGLAVGTARAELIAGNLAHSDTPGFKAQDIDFRKVMAQYVSDTSMGESELSSAATGTENMKNHIELRNQIHPSLDGNTVNTHLEYVEFAQNAERYKASLTFLNDSIQTIMTSIKGN
jgi:flagellar basal-body rod protein FlgB